jgi:SRSO17 transposase
MAAGLSVGLGRWRHEFDELMLRVGARFARVEPRQRIAAFVQGLLAGLPRVNCWSIAEHAGEGCPRGMQRLLSAAVWDEAGVRDDLRGYVLEHFADQGAVLVVDETGDLKKGKMTVGVQRQYTGTAGRTENAQVAVYLAYAALAGTALSTGPCTCPGPGRAIRPGAGPPVCLTMRCSPPSPRRPRR